MKLIEQSFEILEQKDFTLKGILQFIEKCVRICYKSEDKITEDSYKRFTDMLISKGHTAGLEFGTVHIKMTITAFHYIRDSILISRKWNDTWISYKYVGNMAYITTNYRYYLEVLKNYATLTEEDNDYYTKRFTVKFITSRTVSHEIVRHRTFSFCQESQRYCNYSKGKFNNELTFIIPNWVNTYCPNKEHAAPSDADIEWADAMREAEKCYMFLISNNWKPQEARQVLPNSTKTEICVCGFKDAWEHFFELRDVPTVDPQMYNIASRLHKEFINKNYCDVRKS